MAKAASIRFITKDPKAHGVHEKTDEQKRIVLCTVKKVRQSEYYQAHNAGFSPEYQFDLTLAADYRGENALIFEGKTYEIIRTFDTPAGGMEIIAGRSDVNDADDGDDTD